MALPFAVSMALVFAVASLAPLRGLEARPGLPAPVDSANIARGKVGAYLALLGLVVAAVFGVVPPLAVLAVVTAALALADRSALRGVDYALLLTFCCFFVFSGNLARVPEVSSALVSLMESWGLVVSAGLSQVVSNVPAAVLLSHFTDAWQPLLVGVNIGGAGTVVGSLASLITLQHFLSMRRLPSARCSGRGNGAVPRRFHGGEPGVLRRAPCRLRVALLISLARRLPSAGFVAPGGLPRAYLATLSTTLSALPTVSKDYSHSFQI